MQVLIENVMITNLRYLRERLQKESDLVKTKETDDPIVLNVGGTDFTVSRQTLRKIKGSALDAMFSDRHSLKRTGDGTIFIDRDPEIFKLVIEYLRNGKKPVILDREVRMRFERELDFWILVDRIQEL